MSDPNIETSENVEAVVVADDDENYKPPPEKTLKDLLEADKEDESLRKYKEALLGEVAREEAIIVEPDNPKKVIVKKLALVVPGREDVELDLTGDLSDLKKQVFVLKEGTQYRIRIDFIVQREIVHGLKYVQKTSRLGVTVDSMKYMVGSYPPKKEIQNYLSPVEETPSGLMARGSYAVTSLFTDDDKNEHLKWEWSLEIKKDWQ